MEDLESRLKELDAEEVKDNLIAQLASRDYRKAANPYNPYLKEDLIPAIIDIINLYAKTEDSFISNLNSQLNKDEAKRVYYGLVCMGEPDESLKLIMKNLTDWEKVYFFAGIWKKKVMQGMRSEDVPEIIGGYIKVGIDFLHKSHMIKKAEGDYKRTLKLPQSQRYKKKRKIEERFKEKEAGFKELLDREDGTYEPFERTSMFLDSCSEEELRYLTKKFGDEKLEGYAIP